MCAHEELSDRVESFIASPASDSFEALAMDIFRWQYERNEPYQRLVGGRGIDPESLHDWRDIPAVSTEAFKHLRLCCGPSSVVFRTSGTTRGAERRGEHHLVDTRLYQASLRASFSRWVLPDGLRPCFLALTPHSSWAPDSSLGFMVADVMAHFGAPGGVSFLQPAGIDWSRLLDQLRLSESGGGPVVLLGTAFAFVHLLDGLTDRGVRFRLPAGSRIMDTGGFKGRSRVVGRSDLLRGYADRLGIPARCVVNEYGMTELASQFYDGSLHGLDPEVKLGPHWVRTRVIDPESGVDAPPGQPGLLRHYDLANLDSVLAVETEDVGRLQGDGFVLVGRVEGAEPRGCSLATEDLPGSAS